MLVAWANTFWAEALATIRTNVPKTRFTATTRGATAFGPTGVLHGREKDSVMCARVLEPYE